MNRAATAPARRVPLLRPWWRRWLEALAPSSTSSERSLYRELRHLDAHTLRDIGAPDWVHENGRDAERWLLDQRTR